MIEIVFLAALAMRDCPPATAQDPTPPCEVERKTYPDMATCEAALAAAEASGSWEQALRDSGVYTDHKFTFKCEGDKTLQFTVQ